MEIMKELPEQLARIKIDKQLNESGWEIVDRSEYIPNHPQAVREALMTGSTESDYLLFIDNKAIAVVEAKAEVDGKLAASGTLTFAIGN